MMRAQVHLPTGEVAVTLCVVPDSLAMATDAEIPASALISSESRLRSAPTSIWTVTLNSLPSWKLQSEWVY